VASSDDAGPVDARVVKTLARLRGALLDLMGERPFEAITVTDITTRAGVGYATYFRHYPDKQALLTDVADALVGDMIWLMKPLISAHDSLGASRTLCVFVDANRALCRALLSGGAENHIRAELVRRTVFQVSQQPVRSTDWLPPELGVAHSVNAIVGILAWWLERGEAMDADAMSAIIDRLVIRPVSQP
jgi:AcrR family transcriptional regulator